MRINWIVGKQGYLCEVDPGPCPLCGRFEVVCELPPPILAKQPDATTHVCHPALGGCNQGFSKGAPDLDDDPPDDRPGIDQNDSIDDPRYDNF